MENDENKHIWPPKKGDLNLCNIFSEMELRKQQEMQVVSLFHYP